ncbi:MAG: ABC transporter permease [bacterium]|nr:ABC transporter permease [bacterium]
MAAVKNQAAPVGQVVTLTPENRGRSLWADAMRRLLRNRLAMLGLVIILINIALAVLAPVIAPYAYDDQDRASSNSAPYWVTQVFPIMKPQGEEGGYVRVNNAYPFGTDAVGRDIFSRLLYGSRVSLMVAFIGPLVAIVLGMLVGLTAGYAGGWVDNTLMRFVDIFYAFPTLLFIILLMTFFRLGLENPPPGSIGAFMTDIDRSTGGMVFIFIGIGLTSWMQMARLVRGQVLAVREKEFIEAARSIGTPTNSIVLRHVLPNVLGPVIVAETLAIPTYISYEAFLSFIGLGVRPPVPSWGSMIAEGAERIISYPNQALFPALALFFVMFAFNFLGDGLRDALDPRMRGSD